MFKKRKTALSLVVPDLSANAWETEVLFVDPHGTLRMAFVSQGGPWNVPVQLGAPGQFPPGAGIAASLRFNTVRLDIFLVDGEGALNALFRWVDVGDPSFFPGRE